MKNISTLFLLGCAMIGTSVRADGPDLSKLPPVAKQQGVTYAKDV